MVVTEQHMSLFLLVYTSWCPADWGRCLSVSHCHESLRLGGGIREWFSRRVRETHRSAHSFLPYVSLWTPRSGYSLWLVPGAGCVARSAPAPGLPTAAPMSRGPPPPAPVSFPGLTIFGRNRFCVYSFASPAPPRHPAPASMSVDRHLIGRSGQFSSGQSVVRALKQVIHWKGARFRTTTG